MMEPTDRERRLLWKIDLMRKYPRTSRRQKLSHQTSLAEADSNFLTPLAVLPILTFSFGLQYMDKAVLNSASVFGIIKDLVRSR